MTSRSKFSALTWTSVAFAAVLVPTFASAQTAAVDERGVGVKQRVKPEYDPLGIRAGAFMIRPQITASAEYNDNIFATNDTPITTPGGNGVAESDWIYRITPSVDIRSDWSRNQLGLAASLTDSRYSDFGNEDHTDWNVVGNGRLDIGPRGSLRASAGYSLSHEPRTDGAAPQTALEQVEIKSPTYSVGATQEFNRLRVLGDITYTERDYTDVRDASGIILDQDVRDYQQTEYLGRAEYALPKGGVVFVEAGYNEVSYDNLTPQGVGVAPLNQDSSGYRALIGTRVDLTNLLQGEVAVGYMNQDYDDNRIESASGLAVRADLQWFITGITTIGFGGARNVQESGVFGGGGGAQGGAVINSSVYARVDHELQRNIILSGDVAFRDQDYQEFDRDDNYIEAGLGAEYLANRLLSFGIDYRYADRTSDGTSRAPDFTINALILKATARF